MRTSAGALLLSALDMLLLSILETLVGFLACMGGKGVVFSERA